MNNIEKGKNGEKVAIEYLMKNGYKILETNYRNKIGEIDIIALYKDIIVFVEVKSRSSTNYGYAYEAVNFRKQRKIINTSLIYMKYKKIDTFQLRYDIIEVYFTNSIRVNHIENAFCL
ncbi:MAG: YraN family protein [Tissierellaceae bacterium]|nr:YraN family protein [Tissierellaceae bacterium]